MGVERFNTAIPQPALHCALQWLPRDLLHQTAAVDGRVLDDRVLDGLVVGSLGRAASVAPPAGRGRHWPKRGTRRR